MNFISFKGITYSSNFMVALLLAVAAILSVITAIPVCYAFMVWEPVSFISLRGFILSIIIILIAGAIHNRSDEKN